MLALHGSRPPYGAALPSSALRPHDAGGLSPGAHAVIRDHDLDLDRVAGWRDHYGLRDGENFNKAPETDFDGAPLGRNLAELASRSAAFAASDAKFKLALGARNYAESDSAIGARLKDGAITDTGGGGRHIPLVEAVRRAAGGVQRGPVQGIQAHEEGAPVHTELWRARQLPAGAVEKGRRPAG